MCSCLHNCSHQQTKRASWTTSTTWLSRWAMSNSNLSKLASSAPTSFLQCTPPSVLPVISTSPPSPHFLSFPLLQICSCNNPLLMFCFLPATRFCDPAHLICTISFFLGFRTEKGEYFGTQQLSLGVRQASGALFGYPGTSATLTSCILATGAPNPQSAGARLPPGCSPGLKCRVVQGLSNHCRGTQDLPGHRNDLCKK